MGTGASLGTKPEKYQRKVNRFKGKILKHETLSDRQKIRLLEQMSHELKIIMPPPPDDPSKKAATKIQSIQRVRSVQEEQRRWVNGNNLFDVYDSICKAYRHETMTFPVFLKFCKECKLVDEKFKPGDINKAWNEIVGVDTRNIKYDQFLQILAHIGENKGEVSLPDEEHADFHLGITIRHYSIGRSCHLMYGVCVENR